MEPQALTSFTPLSLFLHAGPVAKAVLLLLLAASIWCWVLIVEGLWRIYRLTRAIEAARQGKVSHVDLLMPIVEAGRQAAALSISGETIGEFRSRVSQCMDRASQTLVADVEAELPNLAVISSVAPFVGLFGTVWGIMVSFAAIGQMNDTSLAVVAPGIAEALAATALGIGTAIPASVGYNRLGASLARANQRLQNFIQDTALRLTTV
jgi:biopolymer transport protein ExbB/TolQ